MLSFLRTFPSPSGKPDVNPASKCHLVSQLSHTGTPDKWVWREEAIDVDAENIPVSQSVSFSPVARSVGGASHFRAPHPNTKPPQNVVFLPA